MFFKKVVFTDFVLVAIVFVATMFFQTNVAELLLVCVIAAVWGFVNPAVISFFWGYVPWDVTKRVSNALFLITINSSRSFF